MLELHKTIWNKEQKAQTARTTDLFTDPYSCTIEDTQENCHNNYIIVDNFDNSISRDFHKKSHKSYDSFTMNYLLSPDNLNKLNKELDLCNKIIHTFQNKQSKYCENYITQIEIIKFNISFKNLIEIQEIIFLLQLARSNFLKFTESFQEWLSLSCIIEPDIEEHEIPKRFITIEEDQEIESFDWHPIDVKIKKATKKFYGEEDANTY